MIKGFEAKAPLAKACPHCGGKKIVMIAPGAFRGDGLKCMWLTCDNCGARVSGCTDVAGDYNTAYRDALKKWNRRTA